MPIEMVKQMHSWLFTPTETNVWSAKLGAWNFSECNPTTELCYRLTFNHDFRRIIQHAVFVFVFVAFAHFVFANCNHQICMALELCNSILVSILFMPYCARASCAFIYVSEFKYAN